MASRKRPLILLHRRRRSARPLLENLEGRIVLSQIVPDPSTAAGPPPVLTPQSGPGPLPTPSPTPAPTPSAALAPQEHLAPYPLASGGTGWMLMPGPSGAVANQSQGSTNGTSPSNPPTAGPGVIMGNGASPSNSPTTDAGVIMGSLPVASPLVSGGPQQMTGPAGYTPAQIRTAYGVNQISFAGITGDGLGQTIGIFEEGYNPAFVSTSDPNYRPAPWRSSTRPSACPIPPA